MTSPATTQPTSGDPSASDNPAGAAEEHTTPQRWQRKEKDKKQPLFAATILDLIVAARPGGQHRPQQQEMVRRVDRALAQKESLLVQAGTGCGKSLAYLSGVAANGGRTVISTVTKQLSEQLTNTDLPVLNTALTAGGSSPLTYALLKGRSNYACKQKVSDLLGLDEQDPDKDTRPDRDVGEPVALFDMPANQTNNTNLAGSGRPSATDQAALRDVLAWEEKTQTGDRSEAPPVLERVWSQVSTDSSWCPGAASCPFGSVCYAEKARKKARTADVVITNHALLALDMLSDNPTFGAWDQLVIDEAHEFVDSLTKAWAYELHEDRAHKKLTTAIRRVPVNSKPRSRAEMKEQVEQSFTRVMDQLRRVGTGRITTWDEALREGLHQLRTDLRYVASTLEQASTGSDLTPKATIETKAAFGVVFELVVMIDEILSATPDEYAVHIEETRTGLALKADPLDPGSRFQQVLAGRPVIATSATLAMGTQFDLIAAQFGLVDNTNWQGVDVGTPFDYGTQGILYVAKPTVIPEPVGKDRANHADAVRNVLTDLVAAAGGRTLALFSTTQGAIRAGEHLRKHLPGLPILVHGEAPPGQLVADFREDERSVLCATMGMWSGVDVPGPSLSVVTIDAFPFPPPDDPLLSARKEKADREGKNGWYQVYLLATVLKLKQGAGRAHRSVTDRAMVALLDPRALTKRYGKTVLESLPPMWLTTDLGAAKDSLTRLTGGPHPDVFQKAKRTKQPPKGRTPGKGKTKTHGPTTGKGTQTRRAAPSAARTRAIARGAAPSPKGGGIK